MHERVRSILSEVVGRPALHRAVSALVERLGWHPGEQVGADRVYVELSISYLSTRAEVSIGTAHTAWHLVRGALGWDSLPLSEILALGITPRTRRPGQRWGQHLLVAESVRSACRRVVEARTSIRPEQIEWRPIERVGRRAARCPWHDDRRPSAIWNEDPGGQTACVVCMCCRDESDRPLVALAERTPDGSWRARLSARTLRGRSGGVETLQVISRARREDREARRSEHEWSAEPPTRTLDDLPVTSRRGEVVLGRLSLHGMARRASHRDDLLEVLRSADSRSGDRDWGSAIVAADSDSPSAEHPDRLVSVQKMRPIQWRSNGRFSRPSRWRPIEQRWVLLDLDGMAEPLTCRDDVRRFVARVAEISSTDSWLDGAHAVVRTSSSGVQIWMRLVDSVDPDRFSASRLVRYWLAGLGETLADEIDRLGLGRPKVDPSAFDCHRYGRRPGWRVKNGEPERATLLVAKDAA